MPSSPLLRALRRITWSTGLVLAWQSAGAANPGLQAEPFASRSTAAGQTRFTRLAPTETGIVSENNYTDPRMWGDLYQEFSVGAVGTGVTVGDYDNDGRPDVYVVSKTERARLFRNLGNWKFQDVSDVAGLNDNPAVWKQGASFVDIDNDGLLDLYVCRFNAPNLLYRNLGNGKFAEEASARGLAIVDACGMASFCDFDRDGDLDVYVQTNLLNVAQHPAGQRDYLLVNDGKGHFTDVTNQRGISGESQGHSAVWWDYDQDGWPDLYVANDFEVPDQLYHNLGDGTFAQVAGVVLPHTPYSAMGADEGDINNDSLPDFLVADMAARGHEKDQRGMASSRTRSRDVAPAEGSSRAMLRNALYLNTGVGRMQEAACLTGLAATDWTWSVRFEDLDNDGWLDLHVTNGMVRELHNADLLSRMMNSESGADRVRLMQQSPPLQEHNLVFRNHGDLTFTDESKAWGLDEMGVSFGAAFADFDNDGDLDLIYTNYGAPPSVFRNDSDTGHAITVRLRGTASNRFGVGARVEIETVSGKQLRSLFLSRGYLSASEPAVHFGLGTNDHVNRLVVHWPSGRTQELTDLPADRAYLITEPSVAATTEGTAPLDPPLFSEEAARFGLQLESAEDVVDETAAQPLLPRRFHRRGPALAIADLNGDGRDDLAVGGTTRSPLRILFANTDGSFSPIASPKPGLVPLNDGPLLLIDANRDGMIDLLQTRGGANLPGNAPAYQPRLWLNAGQGNFSTEATDHLPKASLNTGAAAAADFDQDGFVDAFIGSRVLVGKYPTPPRSILLHNTPDGYEDASSLLPGIEQFGMVTAALWSDLDLDGFPDLVIASEWGMVRSFHNDRGKGFTEDSLARGLTAAGAGWWSSLAAGDFNRDGYPDLVAGNVGLNTPYAVDATHPAVLLAGDFKGGAPSQLLEAVTEEGKLYPVRARKNLAGILPSINRDFPKNDAFAKATIDQLVAPERLAAATRLEATQFQSGVFLSQGNGTFRFEPLPRIVQISPVQGMISGDLDGDGLSDLALVQNSFAPVPFIGRFDGGVGQVLLGNGKGEWRCASPRESGWVVPGDAKALARLDLNGDAWPDFLVSRNASTLLAFVNHPTAGNAFLRVRLQGPPGNPSAIGARLVIQRRDGTSESLEQYPFDGYYSQSSADLFVGGTAANRPESIEIHFMQRVIRRKLEPDAKTLSIDLNSP